MLRERSEFVQPIVGGVSVTKMIQNRFRGEPLATISTLQVASEQEIRKVVFNKKCIMKGV
jgi:hypothetical protein